MNLHSIRTHALQAALIPGCLGVNASAQVAPNAPSGSATRVAAEMTMGRLNPAESKPGDRVVVKLKGDVKSNGEVVLKRDALITGVVTNVRRYEEKAAAAVDAQSMIEIEWLAPVSEGKTSQTLSVALQSLLQTDRIREREQAGISGHFAAAPPPLIGGNRAAGQPNLALLSMPSVIAADYRTSSAIEDSLGWSSSGQLFKTGRGELITSAGSRQSLNLYSHLKNDTVITSQTKNFEISAGAQMQLLIGVNKK